MTKYEEITIKLRKEMNGAVSGSMRSLAPKNQRKINFGVSLPTIKDICQGYKKDHSLANELRKHNIREWWLAAAFIDNPESLTENEVENIANEWVNSEESDIYAMYLLCNVSFAFELALKWIKSDSPFKGNAAEKIILKLSSSISDDEAKIILSKTSSEIPVRSIYQNHPNLRSLIRNNGPYPFSWILDEIDNI